MKCAIVSIIGRPSAGKSTLLNTICKEKVSITAPSPQTTRNAIRGIFTEDRGQLIFIDTPGYHLSDKSFNQRLVEVAKSSLAESDIILYVVDTTRPPGAEEEKILSILRSIRVPIVVAANKTDVKESSITDVEEFLSYDPSIKGIYPLSAVSRDGVTELLTQLFKIAPEGEQLYPDEFYTDQPPEFRAAEIIREKVVNRVSQELPHALYVDIADMELDEATNKLWIRAFIIVERESQVGIVVGKKGSGIQGIRKEAQKELKHLFPYDIHLDVRVKSQAKWKKQSNILNKLIY